MRVVKIPIHVLSKTIWSDTLCFDTQLTLIGNIKKYYCEYSVCLGILSDPKTRKKVMFHRTANVSKFAFCYISKLLQSEFLYQNKVR